MQIPVCPSHIQVKISDDTIHDKLFRRQISDDICRLHFYFNRLLYLYVKIECQTAWIQMRRLIEPYHLDLCCLQKPIIIACGSERVNQTTIRQRTEQTEQNKHERKAVISHKAKQRTNNIRNTNLYFFCPADFY